MSHITTIAAPTYRSEKLRDLSVIRRALTRVGFHVYKRQTFRSYDNLEVPSNPCLLAFGLNAEEENACTYEGGVNIRQDGSYDLGYDQMMARRAIEVHAGTGFARFFQMYDVETAKDLADSRGHAYEEQITDDGSVELSINIPENEVAYA